jgi:ParB family transcriptional regulator, chromosome partitioning protein
MSTEREAIKLIPISNIHVLNPRSRNKAVFQGIVSNISALGLKRPVTVSRRERPINGKEYDLVCGQGRMEAYAALGETEIPCIVVKASEEDRFLMSLVENVARRRHSSVEMLRHVSSLKERGHSVDEIARKIDMDIHYVYGIVHLLEHGEERLVREVEKERIPITIAMKIASSDDQEVQRALTEAYDNKSLRGEKLKLVRRIIAERKGRGKRLGRAHQKPAPKRVSAQALVRIYRQETDRQKLLVKKAAITENRMLIVVSALKRLLRDEDFVTLLRAEGIDTMPQFLADRISTRKGA